MQCYRILRRLAVSDAINSDTYEALCKEAEDYISQGRMEQARELLLKAISLIGTRARARSLLADACMSLGLWSEARAQLQVLTTLEIGNVQHHYRLGQVLEELGENLLARDNYKVVLEKDAGHHGAQVALNRLPAAEAEEAPETGDLDLKSLFGGKPSAAVTGEPSAAPPAGSAGAEDGGLDLASVFDGSEQATEEPAGEPEAPIEGEAPGEETAEPAAARQSGLDLEAMFSSDEGKREEEPAAEETGEPSAVEEETREEPVEPPPAGEAPGETPAEEAAAEEEPRKDFQILPDSEASPDVFATDSVPEDVDTLLKDLGVSPDSVSVQNQEEVSALLSSLGIELPTETDEEGEEEEGEKQAFDLEKLSSLLGTAGALGGDADTAGEAPAAGEPVATDEEEEAGEEEPAAGEPVAVDEGEAVEQRATEEEAPAGEPVAGEVAEEPATKREEAPTEEPEAPPSDALDELIETGMKQKAAEAALAREETAGEPAPELAEETPAEEEAKPEAATGEEEETPAPEEPEEAPPAPAPIELPSEPASFSVEQGETDNIVEISLKSGSVAISTMHLMGFDGELEMQADPDGVRTHLSGKGTILVGLGSSRNTIVDLDRDTVLRLEAVVVSDSLLEAEEAGLDAAPGLHRLYGPSGSTAVLSSSGPCVAAKLKGKNPLVMRADRILCCEGDIGLDAHSTGGDGESALDLVSISGKGRVYYSS